MEHREIKTLFLSQLNSDFDEQTIQSTFEDYPEIKVNVIPSKDGSRVAFVEFKTEEEAKDVLAKLTKSGLTINGSEASFEMARSKSHPDSKLGKRMRSVYVSNISYETEQT
jgi:RNA recognition motif-containing protein